MQCFAILARVIFRKILNIFRFPKVGVCVPDNLKEKLSQSGNLNAAF